MANTSLGTEHNAPLTYAPGLELHHPIMSMLGGHGGQLERDYYILVNILGSYDTINIFDCLYVGNWYFLDFRLRWIYICDTWRVQRENVTKTDIYLGSYRIHIFIFLTLLRIFVPHLEILFCCNHYF